MSDRGLVQTSGNHKRCTRCGRWLPSTKEYFFADARTDTGLQAGCKDCYKEHRAAYLDRTREDRKKRAMEYYWSNRDALAEAGRRYRQSHRQSANDAASRWSKRHPAAAQVRSLSSQSRAKTGYPICPIMRWWLVGVLYHDQCVYCGDPMEHFDHVIPYSRGGQSGIDNIVPTCEFCNRSKHSRTLLTWLSKRRSETNG